MAAYDSMPPKEVAVGEGRSVPERGRLNGVSGVADPEAVPLEYPLPDAFVILFH